MFNLSLEFVLLFVKDPQKSAEFYERILGLKPCEVFPTFALFAMPNGIRLGLWSYQTAQPPVLAQPGGCEIAFAYSEIDNLFAQWKKMDVIVAQELTNMNFGRTFVILDPDGHRIRIYSPQGKQS